MEAVKKKATLEVPGVEPRFLGCPGRVIVNMPIELTRLLISVRGVGREREA
jgi:hypothetical protein